MTDKIISTSRYRHCTIVEYKVGDKTAGVDLVDTATGRWITCRDVRSARWTAPVWARLQYEFGVIPAMPPKHPDKHKDTKTEHIGPVALSEAAARHSMH